MFALAFLLISLPESLLKDENSPYNFTNAGYYEQFQEAFEQDTGYQY